MGLLSTIETGDIVSGLTTVATSSSTIGISIDSTGSSATNANLPPFVVAYMWKRTA
jgi:hypothetical protein